VQARYYSRRDLSLILTGSFGDRDLCLARDAGLAEAAGRGLESVARLNVFFRYVVEVVEAFLLIMALLPADGVRRAPLDAFAAAAVEIIEAVCVVIVVGSL
jgi:hypothetical protein